MRLEGIAVSSGIAVGTAQIMLAQEIPVLRVSLPQEALAGEIARLQAALRDTVRDVEALKDQARAKLSEDFLAIFDAHVVILKDPTLLASATQRILQEQVNAEYALQGAIQDMVRRLVATEDSYFQDRAMDLEDLHRRILMHLAGVAPQQAGWSGRERDVILLADALTPSETGSMHNAPIIAFVTEHGARTSHTAIIARSLEIPAVVAVKGLMAWTGSRAS